MAELEKKLVYDVLVSGSYKVEARNPDDAINKTKEYFEENISKLAFSYHEQEVWVEVKE